MAMTKTERIAREKLIYHIFMSKQDDALDEVTLRDEVPDAWHMIEADVDCHEPKEKVTLYLDRSVARIFRAMGQGYQGRINRILGTWIQMRAAGLLEQERKLGERLGQVYGRGR